MQGGYTVISRIMDKDTLKGFLLVDTTLQLHSWSLEQIQAGGFLVPYLNAQYDAQYQTLVGTHGSSLTDYPGVDSEFNLVKGNGIVVASTIVDTTSGKPVGVVAFNGFGTRYNLTYAKLNELTRKYPACNFKVVVDPKYGAIAVRKDGSYFDTVEITRPKSDKDDKSCVTVASPSSLPVIGVYSMDEMKHSEFGQSSQDKLVRTMLNMSKLTPYYYTILQAIRRKPAPIGTMAVTEDTMYYDPKFVSGLKVSELTFVMIHEIMHLAMQHPSRFGVRTNSELWNIATDLYINSIICKDFNVQFGKGPVATKNIGEIKTPDFGVYIETIGEKIDLSIDTPETIYTRLMKENMSGSMSMPGGKNGQQSKSGQQNQSGKQSGSQGANSNAQQQEAMEAAMQQIKEGVEQVKQGAERAKEQSGGSKSSQQAGADVAQGLNDVQKAADKIKNNGTSQESIDSAQDAVQKTQQGVNDMTQAMNQSGMQQQKQGSQPQSGGMQGSGQQGSQGQGGGQQQGVGESAQSGNSQGQSSQQSSGHGRQQGSGQQGSQQSSSGGGQWGSGQQGAQQSGSPQGSGQQGNSGGSSMSPQEQMQRGMNQIQQGLSSMIAASQSGQGVGQSGQGQGSPCQSQGQSGQSQGQGQSGQCQDQNQSGQSQAPQAGVGEDDFSGDDSYKSMSEVSVIYNGKKLSGTIMRDVMSNKEAKNKDDIQANLDSSRKALQTISTKLKMEEEERGEELAKNAGAGGNLTKRYIEVGLSAGVDWRVLFRNICKDKPKKTFTLAQPNQDYMNMGMTLADRRRIGKPERVSHVKFAIDVSGSVSKKELMVMLSEINNIFNYYKLDGELIYWSTMIGDAGMFSSLKDMLKVNPDTTGGTDVRCVFDYLAGKTKVHGVAEKDRIRDMRAIFIITDGCFSMNFKDYTEMFGRRVVWLITGRRGNTITFNPPFGRVLGIDIDFD